MELEARVCVLGSGSSGNCAALHVRRGDGACGVRESVCLIDLGFSPRATGAMLERVGLSLEMVESVLLTHLDSDHCHAGWNASGTAAGALPRHAQLFVHEGHLQRAYARGLNGGRLARFDGQRGRSGPRFSALEGLYVDPLMTFHDELGAAVFRVTLGEGEAAPSLGYATDLGRATDEMLAHLGEGRERPVDVLVIESNYCPALQRASDRPDFLKRRVMGGRGHLSNQEALEAVEAIRPREHVVLVHLSRQCNDPMLVSQLHAGADYTLTISTQEAPTRWVPVRAGMPRVVARPGSQLPIWA